MRRALAAAKTGLHPIASILLRQANKGLKRGWSPQTVRRILAAVTKLVATADVVGCASPSVPDSPRAKKDEQQRRKAAKKAKPGRKPTPHDKPWDAIAERQVAKEGKAKAAFAELAILPPHQRDVVRGRAVNGKKLRELATELGISEDQASTRYKTGVNRMRKQLGADGAETGAEFSLRDELMPDTGQLPAGVDESEADSRDNGLIIVNRPASSWLSSRFLDANPEHEFSKCRKSTKLN